MEFIREKRRENIPVSFSCCQYLRAEYEREVRGWYCGSGFSIASIMANGDIGTCLSVPRNSHTVFGNIRNDRLWDVWRRGYKIYREGLAERNLDCNSCEERLYCRGGAAHSWDYEKAEPRVCLRNVLF